MGRGHEKKFFQRNVHTDSQQTYEKILNITNHQENANQNTMKYAVMPVRISQNGYYQTKSTKSMCQGECGEKGTLVPWWWECRLCSQCGKHGNFSKTKKQIYHRTQQFHFWVFIQENKNTDLKRYMYPDVHCNVVYNRRDVEASRGLSIDEFMKKV